MVDRDFEQSRLSVSFERKCRFSHSYPLLSQFAEPGNESFLKLKEIDLIEHRFPAFLRAVQQLGNSNSFLGSRSYEDTDPVCRMGSEPEVMGSRPGVLPVGDLQLVTYVTDKVLRHEFPHDEEEELLDVVQVVLFEFSHAWLIPRLETSINV